jgi:hypothetical protein
MPTVLLIGPYRIGFYSKENTEPPHVHVSRDRFRAKFWLDPAVALTSSRGFKNHELTIIRAIIEQHRFILLEAWREHFGQN